MAGRPFKILSQPFSNPGSYISCGAGGWLSEASAPCRYRTGAAAAVDGDENEYRLGDLAPLAG